MRVKQILFCLLLALTLAVALAAGREAAPASAAEKAEAPAVPTQEAAGAPEGWDGLVFETVDLDGNTVGSRELFAAHTVTMVNVWASWCPPCVRELPELQRLNGEFAEKDCAIVGLLMDGDDPAGLEAARGLLEAAGVSYTVLMPWDDALELFPVYAVPTSFFVDGGGHVLGDPVVGADVAGYPARLEAAVAMARENADGAAS